MRSGTRGCDNTHAPLTTQPHKRAAVAETQCNFIAPSSQAVRVPLSQKVTRCK